MMNDAFDRQFQITDGDAEPIDLTDFVLDDDAPGPCLNNVDVDSLKEAATSALKTVYDPEIPVNIYDLGLIYGLDVGEDGRLDCRMTLTAPGCPVAGSLVREVHHKLLSVDGVSHARTQLVWDPPWTRDRMSEAALLELGFF